MVTHRFQDGHLMARFRYNPSSGAMERVSSNGTAPEESGAARKTKFLVMNEGRLVFEGSEDELNASSDPYINKFVKR